MTGTPGSGRAQRPDAPQAAIVLARCSATGRRFGIRMEQASPGVWTATWAFAVTEDRAAREGYGESRLRGRFALSPGYPGCPAGCRNASFSRCGECGTVSCASPAAAAWRCPGCGYEAVPGSQGGELRELTAGSD